jgi:hypothetical protein
VSHFMNKFRELGFIDYNGHLEVHSSLLSVVLNEQGRTVAPGAWDLPGQLPRTSPAIELSRREARLGSEWAINSLLPASIVKRPAFSTAVSVGSAVERGIA